MSTPERQSGAPLVSVVTPFYNTDSYLAECIESVLAQSYSNWEYILLNNCSTDKSREIALRYAERDSRVRVFENERLLAQPANYNEALRRISPKSKYCKLVQADDWIFPECLEEMVKLAETHPSVALVSSYQLIGNKIGGQGLPYPSYVMGGRTACRLHLLEGTYLFGTPTSLLMRSDVVRGRAPFYSETSLHEDTEACYEILMDHDFGFVHQVLTFTRTENDSITSRASRFNPGGPDGYILAKKYAPMILNAEEYKACLRRIDRNYFRYLGESLLAGREKEFWAYHQRALSTIGETLPMRRMLLYAVFTVADKLLNPGKSLMRLLSRVLHAN